MLRLCSESSRSYPGRPVRRAVAVLTAPRMATCRVIGQESAACQGVAQRAKTEGHSRRRTLPQGLETSPAKPGSLTPLKGQTQGSE